MYPPVISVSSLVKRYRMGDSEVTALDGISLDITAGEYVAIMGPSGSGKSTLMNVLGCLDKPDAGIYRLADADVAGLDDDALSAVRNRDIGFVFQGFHLQARRSAEENVALPLRYANIDKNEAQKRAREMLERVGLGHRLHHRPNELSGGQRQRVAIARALINQPKVIFADEPTGNLDSRTSEEIMNLFDELNGQGQTLVLVTHEDDIARRAARIIRMRDGRIQEDRRA